MRRAAILSPEIIPKMDAVLKTLLSLAIATLLVVESHSKPFLHTTNALQNRSSNPLRKGSVRPTESSSKLSLGSEETSANSLSRVKVQSFLTPQVIISKIFDSTEVQTQSYSDLLLKRLARMAEIITEIDGKREDDNSPAITDHYIIFNRCSQFNVRVRGKTIDALGDFDSPFVHMRAESKNIDNRVRLQSVHSNDFVCFNDKGRLVVKMDGSSKYCYFYEMLSSDYYTEFRSVSNPSWLIGFQKNGRALSGYAWEGKKRKNRSKGETRATSNTNSNNLNSSPKDKKNRKHQEVADSSGSYNSTQTTAMPPDSWEKIHVVDGHAKQNKTARNDKKRNEPELEDRVDVRVLSTTPRSIRRRSNNRKCYQFVKIRKDPIGKLKFALERRRKRFKDRHA